MGKLFKRYLLLVVILSFGCSAAVIAANENFIQFALSLSLAAKDNPELTQHRRTYSRVEELLQSGILEQSASINESVKTQITNALSDPSGVESGISLEDGLRLLEGIQRDALRQGSGEGEGGGAAAVIPLGRGENFLQAGAFAELGMRQNPSLSGFVAVENSSIIRKAILQRLLQIPREANPREREEYFRDIQLEFVRSACREGIQKGCFTEERFQECVEKFLSNDLLSFASIDQQAQVRASIGAPTENPVALTSLVNLRNESLSPEHQNMIESELLDRESRRRKPVRIAGAIRDARGQSGSDAQQIAAQINGYTGREEAQNLIQRLNRPMAEGGPQDAQSFLNLIIDANFRNHPLLIVHVIYQTLEKFWSLNPTLAQVIVLIQKVGLNSLEHIKLIMHLKKGAILQFARTSVDYQRIASEIIPGAFQNAEYRDLNNHIIVETIQAFADRDEISRENLRELRTFIAGAAFDEGSREALAEPLLENLAEILEKMPEKIRESLVQRFVQVIRNLYEQVQPQVTNQSNVFYYMIDEERCERALCNSVIKNRKTSCILCGDPFTENQKGICCQFHTEELEQKPQFHIYLNQDLLTYLEIKRTEGCFPIQCQSAGEQHELPLTRDLLIAAGMSLDKVYEIQMQTLKSYYRTLLSQSRGGEEIQETELSATMRLCPSPDCHTMLLSGDQDENGHVRCQLCDQRWCYSCRRRPHPNLTCEQAAPQRQQGQERQLPDYHNPESRLRPCPYCGTPCERRDGCNSVNCFVCYQPFNIVDGAPREKTSFSAFNWFSIGGTPARRYRVPGDRDWRGDDEDLSAYPGARPAPQDLDRRGFGRDPARSNQRNQGEIKNKHRIRRGDNRYKGD